jgi:predicted metalloprotease with PDZ domain
MAYSIEQRDEQLKDTTAAIRYHVSFPNAGQHLLHVLMEVDTTEPEITLALPNWIPGSYKVRDFVANQGDVTVENGSFEWIAKNRLRVRGAGDGRIVVRYSYYAHERTVRQSHVNRFHAFINPANCLMYVEGRTGEIHHVRLDHPWREVSTALSEVSNGTLGALNYDILADSPIEIGDHFVARFDRHGAAHEVAITGVGNFDAGWLAAQTHLIVDQAIAMWGSLPYDRYVFIIQLLPGQYGGLEHARSSVNMFDAEIFADREKTIKLLSLLCHEYFHLWNVKRIRPVELGPFDYNGETYTRMLWLAEGVTSYYDDLMAYRCGFYSREEYIRTLGRDHLSRLLDVPGRSVMSIKDSSMLAWVKLYLPTPDSANRFPSYYLKGGVIFLLLDLWIIAESNAIRSLDDGMRALMERYRTNPERGVTQEEFIAIVSEATGVDVGRKLDDWLDSTAELPIEEIVSAAGLEWRRKEPAEQTTIGDGIPYQKPVPEVWLGVQVEDAKTGVKIAKVVGCSPAEEAGIGADDELVAINGIRIGSAKQFEALMRGAFNEDTLRVVAAAEGRLYETIVTPIQRPTYELVEKENPSEEERKRREKWLGRVRDSGDGRD